jgi:hypothetical protein
MMDGKETKLEMATDQYIYYCGDIYIRGEFINWGSNCRDSFIPVTVIYNGVTTVAIFKDGTRVISRPQPGEKFDKETGLAMCIAKHVAGGRSAFLRLVEKANDQNKKALEG